VHGCQIGTKRPTLHVEVRPDVSYAVSVVDAPCRPRDPNRNQTFYFACQIRPSVSYQVIHRDLKLANVLLARELPDEPLEAKLCDFGLHRVALPLPQVRRKAGDGAWDAERSGDTTNDNDDA
jgi:serine/threonine protein kinase